MTAVPSQASIIICAYTERRWPALCDSIRSALAQAPPVGEVVVVVDHNPELEAKVRSTFPEAVTVANRGKRGLSGARNTGVETARGAALVFLDDDARADPECVARLLRLFGDPAVAGVTARVIPEWQGVRPRWLPDDFLWVVGCSFLGEERTEVRNLLGAGMCLSRRVFDTVGGFDTELGRTRGRLPMGGEETEICLRASTAMDGISFQYEPAAIVHHRVEAERMTWSYFVKRCLAEGISKAHLAALSGGHSRLDVERSYALGVIADALRREARDALLRLDFGALQRFVATFLGLGAAGAGFVAGLLGNRMNRSRGEARALPLEPTVKLPDLNSSNRQP